MAAVEDIAREYRDVFHVLAEHFGAHGGLAGIRGLALLESALARPQHRWAYGSTDHYASVEMVENMLHLAEPTLTEEAFAQRAASGLESAAARSTTS